MVKEEEPRWADREEAEPKFDRERAEQMELARRNDENYRRHLASLVNGAPSPDRQQSDPGSPKFVTILEVPSELFFDSESTIAAHFRLNNRRPITFTPTACIIACSWAAADTTTTLEVSFEFSMKRKNRPMILNGFLVLVMTVLAS
ncbi:hypothetical protein S40285_10420 [Stachybotrys chlorohalonatus IBT 40285]|uniref:Uncharacterized protein n=1 Tax=Stachybotrys chlorohalonatus (strain IBT 40285) TaxID=1283841 RepID=A0A084QEA2_STAC4|nr:hypothetical protein S40285_10420 [Stachybotrys chlorohalonata IBT 40285]